MSRNIKNEKYICREHSSHSIKLRAMVTFIVVCKVYKKHKAQ